MKNIKEVKENINIAQIMSVALFTLCVDSAFAFGFQTYNHDITIRNVTPPPVVDSTPISNAIIEAAKIRSEAMEQVRQQQFQMQQQEQLLKQQEHLQRLRSDPEYAHRDKLNKKSNALGKVIKESDDKFGALNEKAKILFEEFDLLRGEVKPLQDKAQSVLARLYSLREKQKALDISELLPQEKDEIKNFLSKAVELNTKREAMNDKDKTYEKSRIFVNEYAKLKADFVNLHQKYFTEAQKYQHKIEYDNKAYEAFLNAHEKRAEVLVNWAREYEIFIQKLEKLLAEFDKLTAEWTNFCKDIIKHKSFVRKYEKFFKKVEKRLGV